MDASPLGPPALPTVYLTRDRGSDAIAAAARAGDITRVRRGAYVATPATDEPWVRDRWIELGRCAALGRQLGPHAVFTHASAAMLLGCWLWQTKPLAHVVNAERTWSPSNARSADIRRHRLSLDPGDIIEVNGLRVTSPERTIVDCALTMHPRDALVVADSGLKLLTRANRWRRDEANTKVARVRAALQSRLDSLAGHRGVRQARAVIEHADPFPDSPPETVLRWIAVSGGLPRPITQLRVELGGHTFFSDLGWILNFAHLGSDNRGRRVHAEFDGLVKYAGGGESGARAVVAEKSREDLLREAGDLIRRFIHPDLRDEAEVLRRLCTAFPRAMVRRLRPVPELQGPVTVES
jgi:hypothetical protein